MDLSELPAVDGHCHPLFRDPWRVSPAAFLELLTEARPGTMAAHVSQTSLHRRAVGELARRLGTEPTVDAVLERRRTLPPESARLALQASRVTALLVDTGYPPDAMPLAEMRRLLGCAIHEIFRIETCAERLLARRLSYDRFLDAFRGELHAAAEQCVAFKSIIAYRCGLAVRAWRKSAAGSAYRRARARLDRHGSARLTDKPLLDTLFVEALEIARETGRPLQVHTGFGDPDIDLPTANPLLLRPILEDARWREARIVLLHMAYPYFREAAFMTASWPQVHLDLSLAVPFLGAGAIEPLLEVLSLAPATKLLYGSDLRGLPELLAVSADWMRAILGQALGRLEAHGDLDAGEARVIARRLLAENARALYGLAA